jgi:transcriptional regulator GlxA family with amidase domain
MAGFVGASSLTPTCWSGKIEPVPVRQIVIVAFPGVQALDITGPHEVFAGASNVLADRRPLDSYRIRVVAHEPGRVVSESGLGIHADGLDSVIGSIDTLILPGGTGVDRAATDQALCDWIAAQSPRRLATVCSGPILAAAAGVITGCRVTTHWARAAKLAANNPDLTVDPDPVYINDGNVWSSAGVTAGIDLALALVREDVGVDVAQTVARWLVMFLHRPANQSQFAAPVWIKRAEDDAVRQAQELIDGQPGDDHRVGRLAGRVAMSERHFQRRFVEQVGMTPGKYVAEIRFEAARRALEESNDPIATIAARTGFGTAESMRRTFVQRVGAPPDSYRRHFSTASHRERTSP